MLARTKVDGPDRRLDLRSGSQAFPETGRQTDEGRDCARECIKQGGSYVVDRQSQEECVQTINESATILESDRPGRSDQHKQRFQLEFVELQPRRRVTFGALTVTS